jgi:prevent-host-death family protein
MDGKTIGAAEFKASCLRVIDQIAADREPVTITKRGRPVAVLTPIPADPTRPGIVGALRGSVLRYDDPFEPATDPADWSADA